MSFVEKAVPPLDVEEGTILKAKIINIKKVTSKWKDDAGNLKEQLQFNLEFENGYKCRSWLSFYERPSDKSKLGKLALKFTQATKKEFSTVNEFLTALKEFGFIFVKCKGFREYEEELYPNFSILTDKIPVTQQKLKRAEDAKLGSQAKYIDARQLLTRFKEAIGYGLPLNQDDWNKSLLVEERLFLLKQGLVEKKENFYFFTEKAKTLFQ